MTAPAPERDSVSLYVHWPFCVSKCPYCDFNSHAADPGGIDQARWRGALVRELETVAAPLTGRALTSVFFGGGTPGLMAPETAAAIITAARTLFTAPDDLEITLEANPSSAEAEKFRDLKAAGVTRLSVGVQALDDAVLAFLGRVHDAATARKTIEMAAETFDRFSFDMIYARPDQTVVAWRDELKDALGYGPRHLSLYQLTIEPGTAFFRDGVPGADEDIGADLYEATQAIMADAGLRAYEISNHAAPGETCRHNVAVWRGGDYLGIGPGAHGRITQGDICTAHHRKADPIRWIEAVEAEGHGTAKDTPLNTRARVEELVMLGLRLTDGIDEAAFAKRVGVALGDVLSREAFSWLCDDGFIERASGHVRTTEKGRMNLNAVLGRLLS